MPQTDQPDPPVKRNRVVAVRLTDEEYAEWKDTADNVGRQQLGRWVREHVARSMQAEQNPEALDAIAALRKELIAAGNNLNQLTRNINAKAKADKLELPPQHQTWKALTEHRKLLAKVRDALNKVAP